MKPTDTKDLPNALVETHNQLGKLVKNLADNPARNPSIPPDLQDRLNKQIAEFSSTLVEIDRLAGIASFA